MKTRFIAMLLVVFAANLVFVPATTAAESELEEQLAAVLYDATQARFTITNLFHFRGRFPAANQLASLTDPSEWIQTMQWDGAKIRITTRPMAAGMRLSIFLTPTLVAGNRLDWACESIGGGKNFPSDCTSEMNAFMYRTFPESRTPEARPPALSDTPERAREQVIAGFFAESLRLMTWISSYIELNGKLPAQNEIGFPGSRSDSVNTIRWNGREVWVEGVEEVVGGALVLVLTPRLEETEKVFWSCRSMGKVAEVPTDCTSLLKQD